MSTPAVIRSATSRDRSFIRSLSRKVFARFGDYEAVLPRMVGASGFSTFIAETKEGASGFAMVEVLARPDAIEADLVAIAVVPERQGGGIGRLLLEHVEQYVLGLAHGHGARLQLCVADDNDPARGLFTSRGFGISDPVYGRYPGGQRTIAMVKRLR